jgi:hypothetical protein
MKNAVMAFLRRSESSSAPLAAHGRTITLVARTRGVRAGAGNASVLHVRARPAHVEVLDEHGRHEVVRIRDIEGTLIVAIVLVGIAGVVISRILRRSN